MIRVGKGGGKMAEKSKAIAYMLLSVANFSLMQLFVNLSGEQGDIYLQVFVRNFLGATLCIYFIHKEKVSYFGSLKSQPYLLMRSLLGFLGLLFTFYAMKNASLADASIVLRTGPFFTTLVSVIFLKEKLHKIQVPILLTIFAGGWLAANPRFDSSFLPLGSALLAAACQGICYPLLRYFREHEHGMTVIMHFSTFCCIGCLPFLARGVLLPQGIGILYLILIAITGALGQIFLTYAYRIGPASEIAIYDQFSVVFALVLGAVFLHQIPSLRTLIGGCLIVGASAVAYFFSMRQGEAES